MNCLQKCLFNKRNYLFNIVLLAGNQLCHNCKFSYIFLYRKIFALHIYICSLFSDKFLTIKYKGSLRKFYRGRCRFIIAITILFRNLPQIVNQAFSSTTKSVSTTLSICHIFQLLRN